MTKPIAEDLTQDLINLIKKAWALLDNPYRGALDNLELPAEGYLLDQGILLRLDMPGVKLWVVPLEDLGCISIRRIVPRDNCWALVSSHLSVEDAAVEAVALLVKEVIRYEFKQH